MFKSFFSRWKKRSTKKPEPSSIKKPESQDPKASLSLNPEVHSTETSFTFKVAPVELAKYFPELTTAENLLRRTVLCNGQRKSMRTDPVAFQGKFEDFSHREDKNEKYLAGEVPGLAGVIHTAFQSHYALSLSVSDFIILIGQGLGTHVNKNAEKLRKLFVDNEGKETMRVKREDFVLGEQNDWSTVLRELGEQIKGKVKADVYDVVVDDTSVATATSKIASEVTLIGALKKYYSYQLETACGIPQITLEGKREDWQKLKDKVKKLVEMNKDDCLDLKWWLDELVPVVEKICEAGIERKVDKEFWSSIYKHHGMSGGDLVDGWIIKFYPYIWEERSEFRMAYTHMIPRQVCEVSFVWECSGREVPVSFSAGFLGTEFNRDLCQVRPARFWSVTQAEFLDMDE